MSNSQAVGRRRGVELKTREADGPHAPPLEWQTRLSEVYRNEFDSMVRLAYLMSRDSTASHDLVQESFYRLGIALRDRAILNPGGYLRTAVVRACIDRGRRQKRFDVIAPQLAHDALASNDAALSDAEPGQLWDTLDRLPADQRIAIVLRYWSDLPLGEIANICDCPISTVNSRLTRAIASLRKEIER